MKPAEFFEAVMVGFMLAIVGLAMWLIVTNVIAGSAKASVVCQTVNGYTYCWNSDSGKHTTCQTVNGYTYCN